MKTGNTTPRVIQSLALMLFFLFATVEAQMTFSGRDLIDPCGEKVVFRGFDEPVNTVLYPAPFNKLKEMAKTGNNGLRLVGGVTKNYTYSYEEYAAIIDTAISLGMYVLLSPSADSGMIYFQRPEVKAIIDARKDYILIDGTQEVGGDAEAWRDSALNRLSILRDYGYDVPIVFMSNGFGRKHQTVIDYGPEVFAADPLARSMFAIQAYWDAWDSIPARLQNLYDLEIPIQIGVTSEAEAPWTNPSTNPRRVIEFAHQYDFHWMIWAWHLQYQSDHYNISSTGTFGDWVSYLSYYSEDLAVNSPWSLQNTVHKNHHLLHGSCPTTTAVTPAAPSALNASAISDHRIDLNWANGTTDVDGIEVERRSAGGSWGLIKKIGFVNEYSDKSESGLMPGTSYEYRIRAYDFEGGFSSWSNVVSVSTEPTVTANNGTGLRAQYYDNVSLDGAPKFTRIDPNIDFKYTSRSLPDSGLQFENYSVRWKGYIIPKYSEEYTFHVELRGKMKIWIGGELVREAGTPGNDYETEHVLMEAGKPYSLQVEYQADNSSWSKIHLRWASLSQAREVIPQSQFLPDLDTPENLRVSKSGVDYISLSWDDISENETGYVLERRPVTGDTWSVLQELPANTASWSDSNLEPSSSLAYRVRAILGSDSSLYSNIVAGGTPSGRENLAEWSIFEKTLTSTTATSLADGILTAILEHGPNVTATGRSGWGARNIYSDSLGDYQSALDSGKYAEITLTPESGTVFDIHNLLWNGSKYESRDFGFGLYMKTASANDWTFVEEETLSGSWAQQDTLVYEINQTGLTEPLSFRMALTNKNGSNSYWDTDIFNRDGKLALEIRGEVTTVPVGVDLTPNALRALRPQPGFRSVVVLNNGVLQLPGNTTKDYPRAIYNTQGGLQAIIPAGAESLQSKSFAPGIYLVQE